MDDLADWRSSREVEFTRLNTSTESNNTVSGGQWHMVTAPRAVFQSERAVKREGQQDSLGGQFYSSLPRAHFLRPGSFRSAAESSAFTPYSHDLRSKSTKLSSRDSDSCACVPPSSRPHPLAQPGFYSPKIPRSKRCETALSTPSLKGLHPARHMKQFSSLSLPLPSSKTAVFKQSSGLCSKPQGIKTSVVEKPRLMRAVVSQVSPDSTQLGHEPQFHQKMSSAEVSRKEKLVWDQHGQSEANRFQQNLPKCPQNTYEVNSYMHPPKQPNMHLNVQSQSYCNFRMYNCSCINNALENADHLLSSQMHDASMAQPTSNLQDLRRKRPDYKNREQGTSYNMSQVDTASKNVFGQPRVIASLRAACSPRAARKSTIVEDLKKLIVMDDVSDSSQRASPSLQQTRTNSSFSELLLDSASSSPVLSRSPLSRPSHLSLQSSPTVSQPMSTESMVWEKDLQFEHDLLHLPNKSHELEWGSLVTAAETYEIQRMANPSVESHTIHPDISPVPHSPAYSGHNFPHSSPSIGGDIDNEVFTDLPDQLSHLEVVLRRLSRDLLKEKKDKVALLAEVLKLRMSNQHLKEESFSANAQLHKICQLFNINMYGEEEEEEEERK